MGIIAFNHSHITAVQRVGDQKCILIHALWRRGFDAQKNSKGTHTLESRFLSRAISSFLSSAKTAHCKICSSFRVYIAATSFKRCSSSAIWAAWVFTRAAVAPDATDAILQPNVQVEEHFHAASILQPRLKDWFDTPTHFNANHEIYGTRGNFIHHIIVFWAIFRQQ